METMDNSDIQTFHQCLVCDAIFPHYSDLEIHNKTHIKLELTDVLQHDKQDILNKTGIKIEQTDSVPQHDQQDIDNTIYSAKETYIPNTDIETDTNCDTLILNKGCQIMNADKLMDNQHKISKLIPMKQEELVLTTSAHQCRVCEEKFEQYEELEKHCQIHQSSPTHSSKNTLDDISDSREQPCYCDVCSNTLKFSDLSEHMEIHTGQKTFKCEICPKSFPHYCELEKHCLIHSRKNVPRPYMIMSLPNATGQSLGKQDTVLPQTPVISTYKIVDISSRKKHDEISTSITIQPTSIYSGENPFKCDICNKAFSLKHHLTTHFRTHSGEKPYECDICNIAFREKSHLASHRRTHTGLKPYKCNICNKTFGIKHHLSTHLATHTGLHTTQPYKCDVCNKTFLHHGGFGNHRKTHSGEIPFKCDGCDRSSSLSIHRLLDRHKKSHIGEHKSKLIPEKSSKLLDTKIEETMPTTLQFQCRVCEEKFKQYSELEKHCQIHLNEPSESVEKNYMVMSLSNVTGQSSTNISTNSKIDSSCNSTNKTPVSPGQASNAELEKHCHMHLNEPSVSVEKHYMVMSLSNVTGQSSTNNSTNSKIDSACTPTNKTPVSPGQASNAELEKHCQNEQSVSVENNCMVMSLSNVTGQSSTNISTGQGLNLTQPVEGQKPYECKLCNKTFDTRKYLQKHCQAHYAETANKPYKCDVCNRTFTEKCAVVRHMRIHTGEKPYTCDVCKKSFCQSSQLAYHKKIHTGEKPYKCDFCDKAYSETSSLEKHLRRHTGEKAYKCDSCVKSFKGRVDLARHIRTHTGEKLFKCNICNKAFSQKGHLSGHLKTHTGKKPFECDVCNQTFTMNSSLQLHKRIHTGEKPYECDICHQAFSQNSSLHIHKRTHTGEKPYECDICNKSFRHSSNFGRHKRTHASQDEKT